MALLVHESVLSCAVLLYRLQTRVTQPLYHNLATQQTADTDKLDTFNTNLSK